MKNRRHNGLGFSGPQITRRDTLKLALAAAVVSAPGINACALDEGNLKRRKIPGKNEFLPIVGLGSSDTFESGPNYDGAALREVLNTFVKLGGKLVDTSPTYGDAESNIGAFSEKLQLRDDLFMATKVHARGRKAGIAQLKNSEKLLGGPLDLVQVHNLIDTKTQLKTLREWQDEGRVRYVGVTHYQVDAHEGLVKVMQSEPLDFVQFNYSVMTPDAEQRLLPLAADRGIAVIINRPFGDGRFFQLTKNKPVPEWAQDFYCKTWAQFALKYILGNPAVTCAIPATSKPYHLADNMSGGVGELPMDAKTRKRMRDLIASL